jgi:hypothetical protein
VRTRREHRPHHSSIRFIQVPTSPSGYRHPLDFLREAPRLTISYRGIQGADRRIYFRQRRGRDQRTEPSASRPKADPSVARREWRGRQVRAALPQENNRKIDALLRPGRAPVQDDKLAAGSFSILARHSLPSRRPGAQVTAGQRTTVSHRPKVLTGCGGGRSLPPRSTRASSASVRRRRGRSPVVPLAWRGERPPGRWFPGAGIVDSNPVNE